MTILLMIAFLAGLAPGQSSTKWGKYVPQKERAAITKPLVKSAGLGGLKLVGGMSAIVSWRTESFTRAMVSGYIDKDRLTAEEADAKQRDLKPAGSYVFGVLILSDSGVSLLPDPSTSKEMTSPIDTDALFLQRAENKEVFVRGTAEIERQDTRPRLGSGVETMYSVSFPRTLKDGSALIRSLNDTIQLEMRLGAKIFVFEYKIRDIAKQLDEL